MQVKEVNGWLMILLVLVTGSSCSSAKKFTTSYYYKYEKELTAIEQSYKKMYAQQPFNLVFTDKQFSALTLEIKTDTLTYIYQFKANEPRLKDTLNKYHLNQPGVEDLVQNMQAIRCIWINSLDYYINDQQRNLVFISIKPVASNSPFAYKKYYILSYFNQPQYFDSAGRLLVKRRLRKIHKINGDIFRRINDKICYTISGRFR